MKHPGVSGLRLSVSLGAVVGLLFSVQSMADGHSPFSFQLSAGSARQERNRVQIPNDESGTRFSLVDVAGEGLVPAYRLEGFWALNDRHSLRLLLAPLSYTETGELQTVTDFDGATFSSDQPVEATYRFNSWRLGYRYLWQDRANWNLWIGATAKIRDAEIKLVQGDVASSNDNLGFVPLLYLAGEYRFGPKWSVAFDIDALAGGPGRAIDIGTGLNYHLGRSWQIGLQYRALEGGADTDDVYNFAWFNSALVTIGYKP
ncbi:MAG: hypothetical protein AB8B63_03925 [Granulosicoccus sp.]